MCLKLRGFSSPSTLEGSNQRLKASTMDSPGDDIHTASFATGENPTATGASAWPTNVWRHVALVFTRASVMRSSLCSLYLDGSLIGTQKVKHASECLLKA